MCHYSERGEPRWEIINWTFSRYKSYAISQFSGWSSTVISIYLLRSRETCSYRTRGVASEVCEMQAYLEAWKQWEWLDKMSNSYIFQSNSDSLSLSITKSTMSLLFLITLVLRWRLGASSWENRLEKSSTKLFEMFQHTANTGYWEEFVMKISVLIFHLNDDSIIIEFSSSSTNCQ